MDKPLLVSIIIPVYNEEKSLAELLDLVRNADLGGLKREIIVVDDGSTDRSKEIVHQKSDQYGAIIKAHFSPINIGKGAAVRAGLRLASGDIIILQDADLELDPNEYIFLIRPLLSGQAQVVYGSRFLKRNPDIPWDTRWANRFLSFLTNLLYGTRLTDMETAYKVFRREVVQEIRLRSVGFNIEPEFTAKVVKAGYRIKEVPISYKPRRHHEGKKIGFKDGIEAIWTLFKYRFKD